jgi:hypothetical protein
VKAHITTRKGFGGLFCLTLAALTLISCTRAEESNVSKVSLAIPKSMSAQKVGALAFDTLTHLVINVTGDGISQPVLFNWDAHSGDDILPPPPFFELTIPQGSNRLVQVLAVYGESAASGGGGGGGGMQFFYGDTLQSFANANESVAISVSSIGKGAPITSGRIAGRLLDGPNSGPSGFLDILYSPEGKPHLIVERTLMMSGWFQAFGLVGAKFSYRAPNGQILFGGGPVELTDAYFASSPSVMKAKVPLHQRLQFDNGVSSFYEEDPEIYIYGYFGPAVTGSNVVCKDISVQSDNLFKSNDSTTKLTPVTSAGPADLSAPGLPSIYIDGGVAVGTANCTSAIMTNNPYTEALSFSPKMLGQGNDNSAGFRLPFIITYTNNGANFINVSTVDPATKSVAATLLPGILGVFDNFAVFKRVGPEEYYNSESIGCSQLVPKMGFTRIGDRVVNSSNWTANLPVSTADATTGVTFVLCPMKNGGMAESGIWLNRWNFSPSAGGGGGGGGGGGMQPATKLAILDLNPNPSDGFCSAFMVRPVDGSNVPGSITSNITVGFTSTGTSLTVYKDPACYQAVSLDGQVGPNGSYFYMKSSGTGAATLTANFDAGSPVLADSNAEPITFQTPPSIQSLGFLADNLFQHKALECVPFHLVGRGGPGGGGGEVTLWTSNTITVSGGGTSVYMDSSCATPLPTSQFSPYFTGSFAGSPYPGASNMSIFPMFVRAASAGTYNITASQSGSLCPGATPCYGAFNGFALGAASNMAPAQVKLSYVPAGLAPSTCMYMSAEVVDAYGSPTTAAVGTNIDVVIGGSGNCVNTSYLALMDSDCASNAAISKSIAIPGGESRVIFGLKNVAAGAGTCPITATLGAPFNISSPPASTTSW